MFKMLNTGKSVPCPGTKPGKLRHEVLVAKRRRGKILAAGAQLYPKGRVKCFLARVVPIHERGNGTARNISMEIRAGRSGMQGGYLDLAGDEALMLHAALDEVLFPQGLRNGRRTCIRFPNE